MCRIGCCDEEGEGEDNREMDCEKEEERREYLVGTFGGGGRDNEMLRCGRRILGLKGKQGNDSKDSK